MKKKIFPNTHTHNPIIYDQKLDRIMNANLYNEHINKSLKKIINTKAMNGKNI